MSIKGFIVNGSTQKYDYNELDNKPTIPSGGGVSDDLKQALLQLANKIAYVDANGADYYQDLYDALYGSTPVPTTYTVTNSLTHVTNSNGASSITAGSSYTGTLTAATGYTINTVSITMGGNDVTGTSYSGGTITIANVTGNIVITAVATERQATLLSIDAVFTQGQAVIYDTDTLDTLKQYLVVTAYWDDSTSEVLSSSAYTLSGTLTVGTSTITASYSGETDTFSVTVTKGVAPEEMWEDGVPYDYTLVANEYVSSGNIVSYNGWSRTPYLPCKGVSSITVNGWSSPAGSYSCWYDVNKDIVGQGGFRPTAANLANVPSDACYLIISQSDSNMNAITSIVPNA